MDLIEPGVSKLHLLIEKYIMEGVRSPNPEISDCLTEAVVRRCPLKNVCLKILQNSLENTCSRSQANSLLKKRLWHRYFPMNFAKVL